jgi:ribosomal-protein-alanine N-acetyltransferase
MGEEHLPAVLEIETLSFPNPWTVMTFVGEIVNPPISLPWVIVYAPDERVIGYIILWHILDEVQINNFAIHPDFRRKGVGECVLSHILETVKKTGARDVFLEVRPSNTAACSLYEKLGFKVLGVRKDYYRSPEEDALIMGLTFD